MDEIEKALELIIDDHNFTHPTVTMVRAHLQLLSFFRTSDFWVASFAVRHDRAVSYEITYSETTQTANIITYVAQDFVTIEE